MGWELGSDSGGGARRMEYGVKGGNDGTHYGPVGSKGKPCHLNRRSGLLLVASISSIVQSRYCIPNPPFFTVKYLFQSSTILLPFLGILRPNYDRRRK